MKRRNSVVPRARVALGLHFRLKRESAKILREKKADKSARRDTAQWKAYNCQCRCGISSREARFLPASPPSADISRRIGKYSFFPGGLFVFRSSLGSLSRTIWQTAGEARRGDSAKCSPHRTNQIRIYLYLSIGLPRAFRTAPSPANARYDFHPAMFT